MKVKFGEIVLDTKAKVDRNDNPYDYYVAGDHMDSEDLEIHRRGCFATDDVGPAFIRLFHAGQVLYGSRRTYLKKIAVADFDGVTANTTFVFETKDPNVLTQELLPFIMLSNKFTEYSILKSKGSTNPYVLFSDLADYEFELPDIEKQRELADLLWSMEYSKRAYRKMIEATDELVKSQFIEMFIGKGYPVYALSELCSKITDGTHKTPDYQDSGVVFISAKNVSQGFLDLSDVKYITQKEYEEIQKRCQTERGDVILSKSGTLGVPAIIDTDISLGIFESLAVLKYDRSRIDGTFLKEQLRSEQVQLQLLSGVKGVAVKHLHLNVISSTQIIVPPLDDQKRFGAFVEQSDKSKFELHKSLAELTAMQKKIIEQNLT